LFQNGNIIVLQSKDKHIHYTIYLFVLLFGLFACANPQPPSGGPPDSSPPIILETKPVSGTVNFDGDEAVIRFNKYMNRPKVIENIYISPPVKIEYSWSGKDLEIEFLEPLDRNLTYTVNLGTEYTDYLGNKPDEGFALFFSPGSVIDSGSINGTLHVSDAESASVYAYRIDNILPDTLNVSSTLPIYRIQIGKSGIFSIKALADGVYRLIAVRDVFRNNIYDEGIDAFGAAVADVTVRSDSVPSIEFKLGPIIDKNGPMLYTANSINQRYVELTFSEDLDTNSINPNAIIITDSLEKNTANIKSAYFTFGSAKKSRSY
jgi:hypothetical protein